MNKRIFIEKRPSFDGKSKAVLEQLKEVVSLTGVKRFIVYDIFNASEPLLEDSLYKVFADKVTDIVHFEKPENNNAIELALEFLPGQYDQRADSALQATCFLATENAEDLQIRSGEFYLFENLSLGDLPKVKKHLVNVVESREKDLSVLEIPMIGSPLAVPIIENFISWEKETLKGFFDDFGFALAFDDLLHIQEYFKKEDRNPTETELKVLDTYWSDHCRHTTFETALENISFEGQFKSTLEQIYATYLDVREDLGRTEKPITLMDLAVVAAKYFHKNGKLDDLVISEEVNACTVEVDVQIGDKTEPWYLLFKNETHNHPTEIEPFGGASTCIGGAIRDPLSGRAYVYQAMRVTGAANPHESLEDTLEGKLTQKKITTVAAEGYSSYGNQIGLATSKVSEVYDKGYKAKRMEVGMVVGAVPKDWVRRETPQKGDVVILLGGATGRDGVGGASGSSKSHDSKSTETLSAEVQKGNAPEERKIQRFFRNKKVTELIKKCNDFGAGGVSVAIGELADSIEIDLDKVPTKYAGLSGTELAISESQERMAVVVENKDAETFKKLAELENLEASEVATITDSGKLIMLHKGEVLVNLDRDFLDTNGVRKSMEVSVEGVTSDCPFEKKIFDKESFKKELSSLEITSQKGLVENFDATVGTSTVLMPLGGKYQLTPTEGSVHTLPTLNNEFCSTVSLASWGFSPKMANWSTLHAGAYAVVESVAKIVAMGGDFNKIRFSFQEYFRKLGNDPKNWGLPFSSLLGAFQAQMAFELAAIGGKDSMSGTFNEIHVPPTLISFAVATGELNDIISPEFKKAGNKVYHFSHQVKEDFSPNYDQLKKVYTFIHQAVKEGTVVSVKTVKDGGVATALFQMAVGNGLGIKAENVSSGFSIGDLIIETTTDISENEFSLLGEVIQTPELIFDGETLSLSELSKVWQSGLENIFPSKTKTESVEAQIPSLEINKEAVKSPNINLGVKPKVAMPVFYGTNCEYDTELSFKREGAEVCSVLMRNHQPHWMEESIQAFVKEIEKSQILMFPGGFSAGDQPDGSAKFIVSILHEPRVKKAIHQLLEKDGLILGICNGFQALVKSGLVTYGEITNLKQESPTLTFNKVGRHVSQMVNTKVINAHSPWLNGMKDEIYTVPVSHGEGRFFASGKQLETLIQNGQIATQYVDFEGNPSMEMTFNPNGSVYGIEGITSPCGKIYGRMAHPERYREGLLKNIPSAEYHNIFKNGVEYFS